MTILANGGERHTPAECGAPVLGQTVGERSTVLATRPASRRVELCRWAGHVATIFVLAAAIVLAAAGCDTVRIKAEGNEKKVDWRVGLRF